MKKVLLMLLIFLSAVLLFADDFKQSLDKLNEARNLVEAGGADLKEISESQKTSAEEAAKILDSISLNSDEENFNEAFYTAKAKTDLILGKYDSVKKIYSEKKSSSEEVRYYTACVYYNEKDFSKVIEILKAEKMDSESRVYGEQKKLLASAYMKTGNYKEAEKVYELLEENKYLSESGKTDYLQCLYKLKKFEAITKKVKHPETDEQKMILAAAFMSLGKNQEASNLYEEIISDGNGKFLRDSLFYNGIALYKLGKTESLVKDAEIFEKNFPEDPALSNIYYLTARSLFLKENYDKALKFSEQYNRTAKTEADKKTAILLTGEILKSKKDFKTALDHYGSYTNKKNELALECHFERAEIFTRTGDYQNASQEYEKIYEKFPQNEKAEDALFRSGEICYMADEYEKAIIIFSKYRNRFSKVKFLEKALYYEFCSYEKTGNKEKLISTGENFIKSFASSTDENYVSEILFNEYFEKKDYKNAVKTGKRIQEKNGLKDSLLEEKLLLSEKIVSGGDAEILKAEYEYNLAGKNATAKGREKGTILAKLYSEKNESKEKGLKLARELLLLQKVNIENERDSAAQNALLLASDCYENEKKKEAADYYLQAGMYFRMGGNAEKAAFCLYTATECFIHLGEKGNALETAALLKEQYPESKYTQAVQRMIR